MDKILQPTQFDEVINETADAYHIDRHLVKAMCYVESSFNPWAMRYENHTLRYCIESDAYASKLGITAETERVLQMCSFGLGQLMGFKIREMGYKGILTAMFDPAINLDYMCKLVAELLRKNNTEEAAVSAYNAGYAFRTETGSFRNQIYVNKVYSNLRILRKLK